MIIWCSFLFKGDSFEEVIILSKPFASKIVQTYETNSIVEAGTNIVKKRLQKI